MTIAPRRFKSSCSGFRVALFEESEVEMELEECEEEGRSSGGVNNPVSSERVRSIPKSIPIMWFETVPVTHHFLSTLSKPARETRRVVACPRTCPSSIMRRFQ